MMNCKINTATRIEIPAESISLYGEKYGYVEIIAPDGMTAHTREDAREQAVSWQEGVENANYGGLDLAEWGNYFEKIGRRYGLLEEFRENAIC